MEIARHCRKQVINSIHNIYKIPTNKRKSLKKGNGVNGDGYAGGGI